MGIENNGYLDVNQTIVSYVVREQKGTFAELIEHDPSQLLADWRKVRRSAQGTSLGCAIAGGVGAFVGVTTMAVPLLAAGLAITALGGYLFKHHGEGAQATQVEADILDRCRPILHLFRELEQQGANPSDLAGLYERLIKAAISKRLDVGEPAALKAFFEREIEQSNLVAVLLGRERNLGIASTPQRQQPQLGNNTPEEPPQAAGVNARLGAVASTAVEVEPDYDWVNAPAVATTPQPNQDDGDTSCAQADQRFLWAKDLIHYPAVLIWGPQGSGKTSFAAWLLHERIKAGHRAWVCDPHKEYGQWNGLKVIGAGMDYEACDQAMLNFAQTVKQAYKLRSEQANYQPQRETVLVEEFTNWSSRCTHAAAFFAASLSDLRKIKKAVVFVSHDKSLVALGNAQGFSKARNNGLLELQLEIKIDPQTGDPVPALRGKLKLPGKPSIAVDIAEWMNGNMDFTVTVQSGSGTVQPPVQPGSTPEPLNRGSNPVQWLNHCLEAEVQDSEPGGSKFSSGGSARFTAENLTFEDALNRINELKEVGLNQTQILAALWRVKKGGNKAYQDAVAQYKLLTGE